MKRLVLVASVLFAGSVHAQPPTGEANQLAMKKLAFLAGKWEGPAEMQMGPGKTESISQSEDVGFRLNGTILVIEGTGRGKLPGKNEEGVVFNAFAVVSYDAATKKYTMRAYRREGVKVDADLDVTETGFIWGFKDPRGGRIRYTMTLEKDGTWKEIGEYSQDEKKYMKFFEMNLKKKS